MPRQVILEEESDDFVVGAAPIREANPMLKAIAEKQVEEKEKKAPSETKKTVPEKEKIAKTTEPKVSVKAEKQKDEDAKLQEIVSAALYAINYSVSAEDMIDLMTCSKFAYGSYRSGMSHMVRDYIEKTKETIANYEIFRANEAERFREHRINKLKAAANKK